MGYRYRGRRMEWKSIAAAMVGTTLLLATAGTAHAEMYVVQVKRIDKDMTGLALNTPSDIEAFLKTA